MQGTRIIISDVIYSFAKAKLMRSSMNAKYHCHFVLLMLQVLLLIAQAQGRQDRGSTDQQNSSQSAEQIHIPNRAPNPLFESQQGRQKTEIHFDPATGMVTLKLLVQDPNGYFIPNIRRDNFVVYENGVRQQIEAVEIEHPPVSVGLLLEFGGRAPGFNRLLGEQVSSAGRQLLDELGHQDKIAIWRYNDKVEKLADFSQGHDALASLFYQLGTPEVSETNLYDALIFTLDQMRGVTGRKALILISSGIDTFSKASYQEALKCAEESDSPIYAISLAQSLRSLVELHDLTASLGRIDWGKADKELQNIARISGGRAYSPQNILDLSPIYDDVMENLKTRYVITYRSSTKGTNSPRTVRVEVVNPRTGAPLQIVDASGRPVHASVVLQSSYPPNAASSK
jgi:Ca-activated chloride channel family protein